MTDPANTPRTAAGRWLLAHVKPDYTPPESGKDFRRHVLAIEAEAVQDYEDDRRLILAIEAEAAAPTSGSLRAALERLFRFHPAPWRSPATLQPWPDEATYLDRIVDASGKPVFGPGNWKDACERNMALVHLVNALAATPEPEGLDVDWPDPNALATALYRDYDYTVTPNDIRDAYACLMRERQP